MKQCNNTPPSLVMHYVSHRDVTLLAESCEDTQEWRNAHKHSLGLGSEASASAGYYCNNNNGHFYGAWSLARSRTQCAVQKAAEKCINTYNGQNKKGFGPYDRQPRKNLHTAISVNKPKLSVTKHGNGKRRDLGSNPLRLSFLFRSCGLWTLSCDFVPHSYGPLKWLSSLPTLMHTSFWWWQCSDWCIISTPPPPPPYPFPPSARP